ncbi:alpha/beta hydrolase family protein [Streptomyces sp. SLBN-118]|nr:alpha/beta hydrolase family protein [Streptomyces sp. SLBN-118]
MTELSISTSAGVFDAIVAGPREGRPVLMLHGSPQTGLVWQRQIAALAARGYRVVVRPAWVLPRRPPQRPEDYPIGLLVDDVVAITEELGWAAFDLVGHDWGGAVAWRTADARPGRVRTLTVVSTPHPGALAPQPDSGHRPCSVTACAGSDDEAGGQPPLRCGAVSWAAIVVEEEAGRCLAFLGDGLPDGGERDGRADG